MKKYKDLVVVVRCKDCKHYHEEGLFCTSVGSSGYGHANWYPNDFCSYGERIEDE